MRLIPIPTLLEMEEEEAVPAFRGTIKRVFGRSTGDNDHGAWSLQNVIVTDPGNDRVEIKVKLKDQEEVPEKAKGRSLYVESNRGERGMTGIKIKVETYQNKPRKYVHVTKTATVTLLDRNAANPTPAAASEDRPPVGSPEEQGEAPRGKAAPQNPPPQNPPPQNAEPAAPAAPQNPPKPADGKPKRDPKQHEAELTLIQQANLWRRCLAVMHKTADDYFAATGERLDGETIRSGTSTLFIQGARDGLYRAMPKELLPFKPHSKATA